MCVCVCVSTQVLEGRAEERIGLQDMALVSYLQKDWQCSSGGGCYFYRCV